MMILRVWRCIQLGYHILRMVRFVVKHQRDRRRRGGLWTRAKHLLLLRRHQPSSRLTVPVRSGPPSRTSGTGNGDAPKATPKGGTGIQNPRTEVEGVVAAATARQDRSLLQEEVLALDRAVESLSKALRPDAADGLKSASTKALATLAEIKRKKTPSINKKEQETLLKVWSAV